MAGRFSVESVFKAVDRVTAPVTRMQNRIGKFTRSVEKGMRSAQAATTKLSQGIRNAGKTIAAAAIAASFALTSLSAAGLDFEQAITDVGAVSLQTRAEIAPLEKMALDLGAATKFTATEAANAMEILGRAGFTTQQILQTTPAILSAAAASGLGIAEVADHVSNALKGMGLEMSDAAMVADVLALAEARTNSSIGSLGESIRNVASTARQLKVPFADVVASVALLQDVGLDASVAGSAFNTMLTKMAAPSAGMQKKMKALGISFKDAKGNMLPLPDVLNQLSIASSKVGGNFDQVAFFAELVGLRGQKAASNLATLFETGQLKKLVEELRNAEGSAEKMANLRMDTTLGSLELLSSAVDAVKVKIFGMNAGPLRDTIDRMTAWVTANEDLIATKVTAWIERLIAALPAIVKWTKRIAIGLAVFYALNAVLHTFIAVMTAVNLVMAMNPIGLIVLAVAALIAGLVALVFWWDEIKAALKDAPGWVLAIVGPIGFLIANIDRIKSALLALGSFLGQALKAMAKAVLMNDPFSLMLRGLEALIQRVTGFDLGAMLASKIRALTDYMPDWVKDRLGIGDDGEDEQAGGGRSALPMPAWAEPQMISPQDRIARTIDETTTTHRSEVTIRDESGRAEMTKGRPGYGVVLQPSGGL